MESTHKAFVASPVEGHGDRTMSNADATSPKFEVILPERTDTLANIVFLHGLDGSGRRTWTAPNGAFWPKWLLEDRGYYGVYVGNYNTSSSKYKQSSLPIIDLGIEVLHLIQTEVPTDKPIFIVSHSLGGLLTKQALRRANDSANPFDKHFLTSCKGIVFMATPHNGSKIANVMMILKIFLLTSLTKDLKSNNGILRDLSSWFKDNVIRLGISILVFRETKRTYIFKIVDESSSDPSVMGVTPIPVEKNHIEICKFNDKSSVTYSSIISFFDRTLKALLRTKIDFREKEVAFVLAEMTATESANLLIVYGAPGIGKTYFSHTITKATGASRIYYVMKGEGENPYSIAKALLLGGLSKLMEIIVSAGMRDIDSIPEELLVEYISGAVARSDGIILVERLNIMEAGECALWKRITRATPRGKIRYIINSYAPITGFDTSINFNLDSPTLEDGVRLLLSFDKDIPLNECTAVYQIFKGHTFSLVSWIKSSTRTRGIPAETQTLFLSIFKSLPDSLQKIMLCVCYEPRLLDIMQEKDREALHNEGLLSKYPSADGSGRCQYYIHDMVATTLAPILNSVDEGILMKLIEEAERLGHPWAGLQLVNSLIRQQKVDIAEAVFIDGGRNWIETVGLNQMSAFVNTVKLTFDSKQFAYVFSRYLEGLILLFSGSYQDARNLFTWLKAEYKDLMPEPVILGFEAERLECERRLGSATQVIKDFDDLISRTKRLSSVGDSSPFSSYFLGVTHFIIGHYFRHFSELADAYTYYEKAELYFLSETSKSSEIEALHCLYAKSLRNPGATIAPTITTKSYFVSGLIASIKVKNLLSKGEFALAERELNVAKDYFSSFGSPHYYKRCLFLEFILYILSEKDISKTELYKTSSEGSDRISLLAKIIKDSNNTYMNATTVQSVIEKLAKSGTYLSILALIEISKYLKIDINLYANVQCSFLSRENDNTLSIKTENLSLHQLQELLVRKAGLENCQDAIFLYD